MVAELVSLSLGATPTATFPIVPAGSFKTDLCADDPTWTGTGPKRDYKCEDWYGFQCNYDTAQRCGYDADTVADLLRNCPETCDTCEPSINVHGDPMFRAGDRYTKLALPEGRLQPLVTWTTTEGTKCELLGSTVAAGDDDKDDVEAQWFTHFRVDVNGSTVLDIERVVPTPHSPKMQVKLDGEEIIPALPGVPSPDQHNSANHVVGLKFGTMGKRYIGANRAERLVLNAGGMPIEITSAAARKYKSQRLQTKYAHFNLHIDKLPDGATGLISELKGMHPLSKKSMSYLREEPHYHMDAAKKTELRQKHQAIRHNVNQDMCPGDDPAPPAPPRAPTPSFADLQSLTPLPGTQCADQSGEVYDADIEFCEQSPDDNTCRQCCDFGEDGPRSICSTGGRCPGEGDELWEGWEGCQAHIETFFSKLKDSEDALTCVGATPVPAACIRAFNILDSQDAYSNQCLAFIDPTSVDSMKAEEVAEWGYSSGEDLEEAIYAERDDVGDEVKQAGEEIGVSIITGGPYQHMTKKQRKAAIHKAMKHIAPKQNKHETWKSLMTMLNGRSGVDTLKMNRTQAADGLRSMIADARKKLVADTVALAAPPGSKAVKDTATQPPQCGDDVCFCVTKSQVAFIIEIVSRLVKHCVKPLNYDCAPKSWCSSDQCENTAKRIMLKACMRDQGEAERHASAHVRLQKSHKNASMSACEAAEYAIDNYDLPSDARPEDYLTKMRSHSTVVKKDNIVRGLRSMLRAKRRTGQDDR